MLHHQRWAYPIKTFTYRELRDEVAVSAGALASHGVTKGDRVLIYMPMVPDLMGTANTLSPALPTTHPRLMNRDERREAYG